MRMEAYNAMMSDIVHNLPHEENSSRVHHNINSESSCRGLDSICAVSYTTSIENGTPRFNSNDLKSVAGHSVTTARGKSLSPPRPAIGSKLEDVLHIGGHFDQTIPLNTLESMVDAKYLANDTVEYLPPKETVEYGLGGHKPRIAKHKTRYSTDSGPVNIIGGLHCVSTIYTTISLGCMFIALLIPALFHLCCQFRLYGSLWSLSEHIPDTDRTKDAGTYLMKGTKTVIDHLSEFENFFFVGVFLYLFIQVIGFYATHARIRRYLWRLCFISVELSKREFLYGSKQRAMEHFSDYVKRLYRIQTHACTQTEQNLVRAFDEASSKFDNYQVDNTWHKIAFLRYRIMFVRIYVPVLINVVLSLGATAFVYDRRFRMYHKVPLAHPDLISNLYWYAAIQYEGFWCIFGMFLLNFATWLYLCHINVHKTLFGMLEETHNQIKAVIFDYSSKLAKDIWDNQMLLFSSTIYAMDSNKVNRSPTYVPLRLETANSQINFGSVASNEGKRPCLCNFLCMPDVEEYAQGPPSFVGTSPFEDLHIPLLEPGLHGNYKRKFGATMH
ncbi:uncharacterized protein BXIN_1592 [Babesia sp. Xinjiang]|uniref:uncharacterized protein n=1 Tax=Babesia sp. Xinjiang TaxID=462227 RepID=UPI000A24E076|nr:uncharacterized protein BXIN_1592 [Babesia sp. Xinjiang]ORM42335.1 hypothetical protein BXIN_1592 [Babesia sp. Xinjiang]